MKRISSLQIYRYHLKNKLYTQAYVFLTNHFQFYKEKTIGALKKLKSSLAQETDETIEMIEIYRKFGKNMATQEEMAWANSQFRDVVKSLGLGVILVLPFSPITLPLLVRLGKKLGVDILPNSPQIERLEKK